jgi:predicted nucleic acid-binding protein
LSRSLVVDASVALKWVVTEPGSEEAASLLDDMAAGAIALLAPEHLVGEVANGLRKRVAQNVLTVEDACAALDAVLVTADERLHTAATGMPVRLLGH